MQFFQETNEEPTDWEEDLESCDEDDFIQFDNLDQIRDSFAVDCEERTSLTVIKPTLEQAKQALIYRLTRQFLSNFQRYHSQKHTDVGVMIKTDRITKRDTHGDLKRGNEEEDANSSTSSINDGRRLKRIRATPNASEFSETSSRFACPYRKHDPRKYSVPNWGPCALTPLQTVARVKAHLYRHHRVHQCQRCKLVFDSQDHLDTHIEAAEGCEARAEQPVDGITGKIKERLQSRKKAYPGQTEADRWGELYQVLFPNEEVPSPYFEPIRDYHGNDIQQPDSREVANYEDYLRRELPKFFKNALESAVSHEMQPIEERLSRQMLSVLEEAQKLAFSKYRSLMGPVAVDSSISASMQEGTHLLTTKQRANTSNYTHQISTQPLLPDPESLLSLSDLDMPQAHELRHAPFDMNSQSATPSEEQHMALKKTESNTPQDSSSSSKSATELDDPLPLPDHEMFESNPPPMCSEGAVNLALLFQDEWGLSSENLDMNIFNWCPAGDLTPPEKGI